MMCDKKNKYEWVNEWGFHNYNKLSRTKMKKNKNKII